MGEVHLLKLTGRGHEYLRYELCWREFQYQIKNHAHGSAAGGTVTQIQLIVL